MLKCILLKHFFNFNHIRSELGANEISYLAPNVFIELTRLTRLYPSESIYLSQHLTTSTGTLRRIRFLAFQLVYLAPLRHLRFCQFHRTCQRISRLNKCLDLWTIISLVTFQTAHSIFSLDWQPCETRFLETCTQVRLTTAIIKVNWWQCDIKSSSRSLWQAFITTTSVGGLITLLADNTNPSQISW